MAPLRSVGEVLRLLNLSPTAKSILDDADCAAASDGVQAVGLRHLILGAVRTGQKEGASGLLFAGHFAEAVEAAVDSATLAEQLAAPIGAGHDLPLSPLAQAVIAQARFLSRVATNEDFIAARHLIVSLAAPLAPGLRAAVKRVWQTQWGIDPAVLHPALREAVAAEARPGENAQAWAGLGGGVRIAPGFAADAATPPRIDPLGVAGDARRLAELACLNANTPPMAVALFGDWGAGKSTFMARMHEAVADIGTTWKDDKAAPFATRVAQIRFNAWTYADGDLWASLATEIFRQLRTEISRLSGEAVAGAQYRALIDRVALRVGASEAKNREALGDLARITRDLEARRADLARVENRAAEIANAPAARRLLERARAALVEKPEAVGAALRALGVATADDAKKLEALVGEARQAAEAGGKARLLGRTLAGLGAGVGWLGWLAAAGVAGLLWWNAPALLAGAGTLAAALVALREVLSRAAPILDAAKAFADAETAERASLAARRTTLEAEISALRSERAAKEEEQTREAAFMARYAGAAKGESPAALLKFFLEQDAGLAAYEQRLGLVSRLRESFSTLEELLAEQVKHPGDTLPTIDRIILYVDDLDRCQPAQVVPVLQALALMLQLKLFVAVVAVDDGWLKAALRIHYKELIEKGGMSGPEQFLEKIFQIPFWLRTMRDTDANRYGAFVAHLAPEAVAAPKTVDVETTWSDGTSWGDGTKWGGDDVPIDPDELPQPGDASPFAHENRGDTVERVSLTEPELNVLTALAPLAGGTPRAVKRFVNLYRLVRSSRQGAALDAFLGKGDEAPQFPAMAFALACQGGLDGKAIGNIYRMRGSEKEARLSVAWPQLRAKLAFRSAERDAAGHMVAEETLNSIGKAIVALGAAVPEQVTVGEILQAWPEAARYSFNRPASAAP
jgi:hypothetical protein